MKKTGKLEIYRNSFLEKEELDRYAQFNGNGLFKLLLTKYAQGFGVVNTSPEQSDNYSFKLSKGSTSGSVSIPYESYAIDKSGNLLRQDSTDNIYIADSSGTVLSDQWVWVKINHTYNKEEDGVISIDNNGNLSGINTKFTEVLRGGSSGFPTYIKFPNSTFNDKLYEVSSVISDIFAILQGDFVAESDLKYVVYGTFALGKTSDALKSGGLYSYDSANISFVPETILNYPPTGSLIDGEEFFIARVYFDSSTNDITIEDKRAFTYISPSTGIEEVFNYYYRLNSGLTGLEDTGWIDCENPNNISNFNVKARQIGKTVNILGDVTSVWGDTNDLFIINKGIAKCPYNTGIYVMTEDSEEGNKIVSIRSKSDGLTWETVGTGTKSKQILINITYNIS